jgi:tight adherence protein B
MSSLSELDLVIQVHRDRHYNRFVSGIYELGEVADSGKPSLTPIFEARRGSTGRDGRRRVEPGLTRADGGRRFRRSAVAEPRAWVVGLEDRTAPRRSGIVIAGVLLLTMAGLLIGAGLVGAVAAARGVRLFPHRTRTSPSGSAKFTVTPLHVVGVLTGAGVLLLTGWPVAGIAVAAAVVFVPSVLGGASESKALIARSEALADWTRRLAEFISSGAAGSTRDALQQSSKSVPNAIAGEVRRLVSRMGPQGTESALRRFAAEVNDPAADKIAGVLILRERTGGPGLADVLTALASDLDDRARMIREVEAERAKPRSNMRTIVVVTGFLIAGMMLFARTFLSGYSSVFGQVMLVVVSGVFAVALRWMHNLSSPPRQPRVLVDPSPVGER